MSETLIQMLNNWVNGVRNIDHFRDIQTQFCIAFKDRTSKVWHIAMDIFKMVKETDVWKTCEKMERGEESDSDSESVSETDNKNENKKDIDYNKTCSGCGRGDLSCRCGTGSPWY